MPSSRRLYRDIAQSFAIVYTLYDGPGNRIGTEILDKLRDYIAGDLKKDNPNFNTEMFKDAIIAQTLRD